MLINKNTKICGKGVILVPYRKEHVLRYNDWMQSETLQILTGSEHLTLQDEYMMQESWQNDEDKLSFIILDKDTYEKTSNEVSAMIGDTNIYVLSKNGETPIVCEPAIMIAEPSARGKGYGYETISMMLLYSIENLGTQQFLAKVLEDNIVSIKMFEKFGFAKTSYSEAFKEITLTLDVDEAFKTMLKNQLDYMIICEHE